MRLIIKKAFRLSIQQTRLWARQQAWTQNQVVCRMRLEGRLDVASFQQALQQLVARHMILRTAIGYLSNMDVPVQMVAAEGSMTCSYIDLGQLSPLQQEAETLTRMHGLQQAPLEGEQAPGLRCILCRLSSRKHILLFGLPSFCADAATLRNLLVELARLYDARRRGAELGDEPLQYADVSAWQNELLEEDTAKEEKRAFWSKAELSEFARVPLPLTSRNYAVSQPARVPVAFAHCLEIKHEQSPSLPLKRLLQRTETSLPAFFLASWLVVYWRLTSQTPVMMGVECDGRMFEELQTALGLYNQVVPFTLSLEASFSFERLLVLVHKLLGETERNQLFFPLPASNKAIAEAVFPLQFVYEEWPESLQGEELLFFPEESIGPWLEPFTMQLRIKHYESRRELHLWFDREAFALEDAQRLLRYLTTFMEHVCLDPAAMIGSVRLLPDREEEQLLRNFKNPARTFAFSTFIEAFEAWARLAPTSLAAVCGTEQITYEQLDSKASSLAIALRALGVGQSRLVALYLERSLSLLVAIVAIFKAGGAYAPLDPDQPIARLTYQLRDLQPEVVLVQSHLLPRLASWQGLFLCLDQPASWEQEARKEQAPVRGNPDDLAYIIYTSGSTGEPKGVMVRQRNLANYTFAMGEILGNESGLHFATVSTLAADLGNTAIFCALASGGCVHLIPRATALVGQQFADYLVRHPIDILKIVPSHFSTLLASAEGRSIFPRHSLILGGEAFSFTLWQQIQLSGCACRVINHYGPTEATIGALVNVLEQSPVQRETHTRSAAVTVPVGRPLSGVEAYILDQYGQIVPEGVVGELYLGGAGIAAGYWRKPEQTRERFVSFPWQAAGAAQLYRTGDLACYRADGTIAFIGRVDSQIKVRGYRVELGEIEAVLCRHPDVQGCAVLLREDLPGEKQLSAYIVARQPIPEEGTLRRFLEEHLPEYMVPIHLVFLHALPLNTNGKVNYHELPPPDRTQRTAVYAAPRTPLEELLAEIWQAVLKVRQVGTGDTFAQLGGHSLLATRIVARIRQALQIDVPLQVFFEAPTVAELARRVEFLQGSERRSKQPELVPVPREGILPLSFAQQRLWFLYQLQPENTAYLIPRAFHIRGHLRITILEQSLRDVINRHEVLHSTFEEEAGAPRVRVHPPAAHIPLIDLQGMAHEQRLTQARLLARQEVQRPVVLEREQPLRTTLICIADDEYALLLTLHHIVSDAWSRDILLHELVQLYNAFSASKPSPLPALPVQYLDFARWQQRCLDEGIFQEQLAYWTKQLQSIAPLSLPTDYPRPAVQTFRGAQTSCLLPPELNEALKQLCQDESTTLFMTLLAAFQVLLALFCDQSDIAVGTPIANRSRREVEGLIGFFTNTLVLRTDLSGNPSFKEVLGRVRKIALQAYANQDIPFEKLVEIVQPERDPSHSPLFQVMFVLQHASESTEMLHDLHLTILPYDNPTSKFDFTLFVLDASQGLQCTIEYNTDLFAEQSMVLFLERWHLLLKMLAANPHIPVQDISLLTGAERQQVLITWNDTRTPVETIPVHRPFEEQVRREPDAIAVTYQGEMLSYAELNRRANRLARYLQAACVREEVAAGIAVERSLWMVITVLAVIKAGGVCVPLDPAYPEQRLAYMLENAHAPVLITQRSLLERFSQYQGELIMLDGIEAALAQEVTGDLECQIDGEQLIYIIYTSGSTGTPKGVGLPHCALHNLLRWYAVNAFAGERTLQFASLGFDMSFFELFTTLGLGGTLVLMPETVRRDSGALAELLSREAIEQVALPVVSCQQLTQEYLRLNQIPDSLREIITTGEQLQISTSMMQFFTRAGNCAFHNFYGPSESHVVTAYTLGSSPDTWPLYPPIGRPIWNNRIYLLDPQMKPVPLGAPGELYIGGTGLARGYIQQPAMTAERFLPDSFSALPGGRLYKTGDLARYHLDGNIEYLGRKDHQIKIRGYRVELGEIETLLSHHPVVNEVAVVVREDVKGDKRLVAYVVLDCEQKAIRSDDLHAYLREHVPDFLVPSTFVELEVLPLNANGKINRQALPHPQGLVLASSVEYVPPRTELERLIVSIWQELLYVEKIGLHDNFFDSGGHSLLVLQVRQRLQDALARQIPLLDLFKYPTVSALAHALSQEQREQLQVNRIVVRTEKRAEAARQQQLRRGHRRHR